MSKEMMFLTTTAVERLSEVLGEKGYSTWLKRRGSKLSDDVIEKQAKAALDNMQKAAEKKVACERLCDDLRTLIESPDTFFGDEEDAEEERSKAKKQLEQLEQLVTNFPLFSNRPS